LKFFLFKIRHKFSPSIFYSAQNKKACLGSRFLENIELFNRHKFTSFLQIFYNPFNVMIEDKKKTIISVETIV